MPVELQNSEKKNSEHFKALKQQLSVYKRSIRTVAVMKWWFKEPLKNANMGEINKDITSPSDHLSGMAQELKCMIISLLDDPADRLMFGLTCKFNAATFEFFKNAAQSGEHSLQAQKQSDRPHSALPLNHTRIDRKSAKSSSKKPLNSAILSVLIRLEDWMPKEYRLCYVCLKYRPKHAKGIDGGSVGIRGYWMKGKSIDPRTKWGSKSDFVKAVDLGPRCPDCKVRLDFHTLKATKEYKELAKGVKEVSKLLL